MAATGTVPLAWVDHWCAEQGDTIYLRQPRNGEYRSYSWLQFRDAALRIAAALQAQGLESGDRVGIYSENCAEWFIADMAIQAAGLVSVPIYATASRATVDYVLEHSDAKVLFVGKLANPTEQLANIASHVTTVAFDYPGIEGKLRWEDWLASFEPLATPHYAQLNEMMSIVYTSGSTGRPKGVVMDFEGYCYGARAPIEQFGVFKDDHMLSYLPLAHITERTVIQGVSLAAGASIDFIESIATFADNVRFTSPTIFISVPRLWKRFQSGVLAAMPQRKLNLLLKLPVISGVVKRKVRSQLGLSRARFCGGGSAPLSVGLLEWFHSLGIDIGEGWGMTETGGLSTGNSPVNAAKFGSIGKPVPGTEIKVSDIGELLIKSPGVFKSYYLQPELTAESFVDGWFKTGDKGTIDAEGFAYITGRVKDIFKSSKGKYIVPAPIEGRLLGTGLIEQASVVGDGRKQPVAVVVLSAEAAEGYSREQLTAQLLTTFVEVNSHSESHAVLDALIVAPEPWTPENGILTPTLKVKRDEVEKHFAAQIVDESINGVVWV